MKFTINHKKKIIVLYTFAKKYELKNLKVKHRMIPNKSEQSVDKLELHVICSREHSSINHKAVDDVESTVNVWFPLSASGQKDEGA